MALIRGSRTETRQHLLTAAGELFVSDGYLETTVAQICSRAGVSNGSFFHLFKTKAQIAEALVADLSRSYREDVLSRLLLPTRSPEQAIGAILNAHLRWIAGDDARARLWFGLRPTLLHLGDGRSGNSHAGDVLEVVGVWAAPLVASGKIRPAPTAVIAAHIFGVVNAIGAMQATGDATDTLDGDPVSSLAEAAWWAIRGHARAPRRTETPSGAMLDLL